MIRRNVAARAPLIAVAIATTLLAGCGDDRTELRGWMENVRATTKPIRETIAEPKKFEPFRYDRAGEVDPFARTRLAGLAVDEAGQPVPGGLRPDTSRPRELLEGYPLDAIRMVGHMSNGKQSFALLQVDSIVHQARVGNHAGQNHGVITRVAENEVRLRELVQDAAGDWVHRETTLQLQEGGK
ncbi:pilus assembly protein PilP [Burkholderiaceae bacterium FT117]|uniref:pilus assembly protein PilP n=1 Tax=Zeimonas sediminis TaxID=2944268 RepID=UPI002342F248|nr:pilus assembly protein PilP [Zeimonas sediminis]MCM5570872.1 pilus assembly protein PilP [Zeimonas sediminis]